MLVNQISVFLENRSGRVAEFSRVLKEANINIQVMSIADTMEYGILRAVTNDNKKAIEVLRANGFNTAATDLVGFKVQDTPGEMCKVLEVLESHCINIAYLYSFARAGEDYAVILLKVDDNKNAMKILAENGINLIEDNIL